MRRKELRLLVTFYTTADAMAMEQRCKTDGLPGRLIPVPRAVTSDCGIAWSCGPELRQTIESALERWKIEDAGIYEMVI